ncbi:phosphopantothenoylcysteine synthetase/decarboxylase [Spiroplasma corruscae]|uniref:Coenzyme A biosynthesis bifunctional protein CoaBC n=1 Tax=Spiroplasma corruscae TaxID=216934 RepID=A0A222EPD5_9MOLU|nr:bifunctional phosphopantothenoylcysteine decarboxylase/phosphopantothenate--cysteine ligase CoaBC [Spiroplasma corruscae]ASP28174.1 phosphopantothenoylcysteine synthetase/decarboxylase [Spiroplasma corruscae]
MKIINLIITGGIAATKAKELYNLLIKKYEVNIIMTKNAYKFVDTEGLITYNEIFDKEFYENGHHYADHIKLAFNSDLNIIYPATYNFIGKVASGISDDLPSLLLAVCTFDSLFFPSMNTNMYNNEILQKNKKIITNLSNTQWFEPKFGKLASGDYGIGRAYEPIEVVSIVDNYFNKFSNLIDKNILLNFGRTRSYIDKVRYITNASSGKMGNELKKSLISKCNKLVSIFGDTDFNVIQNANNIYANTNVKMYEEMIKHFNDMDIVICCGALTDFEVTNPLDRKIEKRVDKNINEIKFKESLDVLKELSRKKTKQFLVGFSLANDFNLDKARNKLLEKNLDMIVINLTNALNSDSNTIKILTKDNNLYEYENLNKSDVALKIIEKINDII